MVFNTIKKFSIAVILTTTLSGIYGCASENDTQDSDKKDNKSLSKKEKIVPDYVKNYNPALSNMTGAYLSARVARFHYDFDSAAVHAKRAFELDSHDNTFIQDQSVRLAITKQDFDSASEFARQIIADKKSTVTPFVALVALVDYVQKSDIKNAKLILEKYGNKEFNLPIRALMGGMVLHIDQQFKQSDTYLSALKGADIFDFLRLYHTAMIKISDDKTQDAFDLLKKSEMYRDPMTVRSSLAMAWIKQQQGDKQAAGDILSKAVLRNPDNMLKAAQFQWKNKGVIEYQAPKTSNDVLAEMLYHIGVIYAREHDYETGLAFFFMADHLAPSRTHIISVIAETYAAIKIYDKSADFYMKLATAGDMTIGRDSVLNAVYALSNVNRNDDAKKILADSIAKDPVYFRYHYALGDLLRTEEKYDDAINSYNKALELLDKDKKNLAWRIHYVRGIAYEQMGDWENAEKDLLAAVDIVPNNPDVVNYLAYSWIDRGQNVPKALILLENAAESAPDNGYIIDSLGWAYFSIGEYNKSVDILTQALQLTPGDPTINEHLGDAYWKVGRVREAYFQWQRALTFNPADKDKKRLEQKISVGLDKYNADNKKTDGEAVHTILVKDTL